MTECKHETKLTTQHRRSWRDKQYDCVWTSRCSSVAGYAHLSVTLHVITLYKDSRMIGIETNGQCFMEKGVMMQWVDG